MEHCYSETAVNAVGEDSSLHNYDIGESEREEKQDVFHKEGEIESKQVRIAIDCIIINELNAKKKVAPWN